MKWSFKVGKIFGIELYLHATFLILIAWLGLSYYLEDHNLVSALQGVGFILVLFLIIVLHELGHALTARRFGIKTQDITLLPIGGVARLEKMPENPLEELLVAFAGPAVNVVLAALLGACALLAYGSSALWDVSLTGGSLLARLFWLNLWLAGFNLIPAFPMDGGRVLRALLAMRMDRNRATQIAANLGQAMAFVFGLIGFFVNPFLIFLALFVWIGAEGEAAQVRMESGLAGHRVSEVMAADYGVAHPSQTLGEVADFLVPSFQTDLPVLEDEKLIGFIGMSEVLQGIRDAGPASSIEPFIKRTVVTTAPDRDLSELMPRWQSSEASAVAVLDQGRLVGIITATNLAEYLMLQSVLGGRRDPTAPARVARRGRARWL